MGNPNLNGTGKITGKSTGIDTEKLRLIHRIGALEDARDHLKRLVDILTEFMDLPRARFAQSTLMWYENDFKDLLPDIVRVANMIDEMPDDVYEYLDNLLIELMKTVNKIERRIYELETQLGDDDDDGL